MKRRIKYAVGLAVAALALMTAITPSVGVRAAGNDAKYAFTTIDFPGATKTFAMDANASGDVVGYYYVGTQMHGFLLRGGTFTTLDYPGDDVAWSQANSISPNGDIGGGYSLKSGSAGNVHGSLLTREGEWSTVDFPEGTHLMAGGPFAVLADGTMVGCYHDGTATGVTAMYGYSMGPKGVAGFAYPAEKPWAMHYGATPDGKTVVGTYVSGANTPDNAHGYLLNDGKVTSFDVPGKVGTNALGIGPSGDIVGVYKVLVDKTWNAHGYVAVTRGSLSPSSWEFTLVDVPGASQTAVRGVDAAGHLVGYYFDAAGITHGFIAATAASAPEEPRSTTPGPAGAPLPPNTGSGAVATSRGFQAAVVGTALLGLSVLAFVSRVALRRRTSR